VDEKEVGAPIGYTLSRFGVAVQRFRCTTNYVLNLQTANATRVINEFKPTPD